MDDLDKNQHRGPPKILTQDQSWTCYSEQYQETFHSVAGAEEECRTVFLTPSELPRRWAAQRPTFKILEVGFGLGLNWQTFFAAWQAAAPQAQVGPRVEYHALEKDESLLAATFQNLALHPAWQNLTEGAGLRYATQSFSLNGRQLHLYLWPGNARQVLPRILPQVQGTEVIWQDAFSPRHNPELWTWQWFKTLKEIAAPQVCLTTYSAATPVRLALQKAGFIVRAMPGTATKKSFTCAYLTGQPDQALQSKLARSPLKALDDQDMLIILRSVRQKTAPVNLF